MKKVLSLIAEVQELLAEAHDPPSYMSLQNLDQILRDAETIKSMVDPHTELDGWVEDKLSQAKGQLSSVVNYLLNEAQSEVVPLLADGDSDYVQREYLGSLEGEEREKRRKEIDKRRDEPHDDPDSYRPFKSNKGKETRRRSDATIAYEKKFGKKEKASLIAASKVTTALKKKADASGISLTILRQVYDRGLAAWRTGHRPGAGQHQWAMARVNSFITGKGGSRKADKDLWEKTRS